MKQQVLFFFFTLMLTGISVSAQTGGGRIAGVVIDNAGEEPRPAATSHRRAEKGHCDRRAWRVLTFRCSRSHLYAYCKVYRLPHANRKLTVGKERGKKIIIRLKAEAKSLD